MKPAEQFLERILKHVIITGSSVRTRDHDIIPAFCQLLFIMPEDLPDPSLKKMTLYAVTVLLTDRDPQSWSLLIVLHDIENKLFIGRGSSLMVDCPEILILFQWIQNTILLTHRAARWSAARYFSGFKLCGEPLSALCSSRRKNLTSAGGTHSGTKTVYSLSLQPVRLKCHFHDLFLQFPNLKNDANDEHYIEEKTRRQAGKSFPGCWKMRTCPGKIFSEILSTISCRWSSFPQLNVDNVEKPLPFYGQKSFPQFFV